MVSGVRNTDVRSIFQETQRWARHWQRRSSPFREGVLEKNPFYSLGQQERYKVTVNHRESLTKDELERFLAVKTEGKAVQPAFGFAAFTGLRISDIQALTWENVWTEGENKMLSITMRKTRERIVIPLGKMALRYMPEKPVDAG